MPEIPSQPTPDGLRPTKGAGPWPMIAHWLRVDRSTFMRILLLASGIGLLSLGAPVAAQGVIGALTASALLPPVFVLSGVLLICLGYLGLLHMLEIRAVEWLSRNIFLRIAQDMGARLLAFKKPTTETTRWNHRFFEVVSIEKSAATMLMSGLSAVLQLLFGLLLLALYDRWFLLFAFALTVLTTLSLVWGFARGRDTAVTESSAKYAIAEHLQAFEVDHVSPGDPVGSRFASFEAALAHWYRARDEHFAVVLFQSRSLVILSAIATTAVVLIGASLVVFGELSMGQLVAAEIVVTGMSAALIKLTKVLPKLYDLYASFAKLSAVPGDPDEIAGSATCTAALTGSQSDGRRVRRLMLWFVLAPGILALPWQQTAAGQGNVMAYSPTDREQVVDAAVKGRVKKWYVMEGSQVKEGEPLVELEDIDDQYMERLERKRRAVEAKLRASEKQRDAYAKKRDAYRQVRERSVLAATRKVQMAEQKKLALEQQRAALVAQRSAAQKNRVRVGSLTAEGITSQREDELAQAKLGELTAKALSLEAKVLEADADIAMQNAELLKTRADAEVKIATAEAELEKAAAEVAEAQESLAKIEVLVARQVQQVVRAPTDGTVSWVRGHQGGVVVKEGESLLSLVPRTDDLAVELFFDGNDVPLLNMHDEVRLQFEGWPALVMAGVPGAQPGTFAGQISAIDPQTRNGGKVRVLVTPAPEGQWPPSDRLRQGMRVQGWAVLNRVSIGYEIWRRVNGFPIIPDELQEVSKTKGSKAAKK